MLDVKMLQEGRELTVALKGELNVGTAPDLQNQLSEKFAETDSLIFDMAELDYISSAGLRVILYAYQTITSGGGTMTVKNMSEDVRDIFEVTGFKDAMHIE